MPKTNVAYTSERRNQQELEFNEKRYVGTGSADTTADVFHRNVHRDTLASFIGHPPMLQYASIGLRFSRERTRVHLLERMIDPLAASRMGEKEKAKDTTKQEDQVSEKKIK